MCMDNIFAGIAETSLSDPKSWRNIIQIALFRERQELGQLPHLFKNALKKMSSGGNTMG